MTDTAPQLPLPDDAAVLFAALNGKDCKNGHALKVHDEVVGTDGINVRRRWRGCRRLGRCAVRRTGRDQQHNGKKRCNSL